jgi:hypothetical protein
LVQRKRKHSLSRILPIELDRSESSI